MTIVMVSSISADNASSFYQYSNIGERSGEVAEMTGDSRNNDLIIQIANVTGR